MWPVNELDRSHTLCVEVDLFQSVVRLLRGVNSHSDKFYRINQDLGEAELGVHLCQLQETISDWYIVQFQVDESFDP